MNLNKPMHVEFVAVLVWSTVGIDEFDIRIATIWYKSIPFELESKSISQTVKKKISLP